MNVFRIISPLLGFALALSAAPAAGFVDNFNNGVVTDSDSVSGFWTTSLSSGVGGANAIVETGGLLSMTAGDNNGVNTNAYSGVLMRSAVSSDFNFFTRELTIEARGISFIGSTPAAKQQIRIGLNARRPAATVRRMRCWCGFGEMGPCCLAARSTHPTRVRTVP